jgi:hypothetical protein
MDYVTREACVVIARPRLERDCRYVPKEECEALWEAKESVDHPDISLPQGWHLNHARVPVPPPLEAGLKLDAEIHRRS